MQNYEFDRTRMIFRKATRSVWRRLWSAIKYFTVTASLAVVYYVIFSMVVSTDTERRLKRENQMYSRMYEEMTRKEELVGDVITGLKVKDNDIYRNLFNADAPELENIYPAGLISMIDSVESKDMVGYASGKLDLLENASDRIENNFRRVMAALDTCGGSLPPMTNPLKSFSYARTGASVGQKISPFYKVAVRHEGLDLVSQQGEPVCAAADGTVKEVIHSSKGLGNVVVIDHGNGYMTRYAHLENIRVSGGQKVSRGKEIGQVGMSGNSFAPHLHYEVVKDGSIKVDPLNHMFASVSPDDYTGMLFMSVNAGQSMD